MHPDITRRLDAITRKPSFLPCSRCGGPVVQIPRIRQHIETCLAEKGHRIDGRPANMHVECFNMAPSDEVK